MKTIQCYLSRPTVGQSFVGQKKLTVPSQNLSLREIIRRFVRREALPQSKDGLYEDRFGDLEKLSRMDIVEKMEKVEELKSQIAAFEAREKARFEKEKADAKAAEEKRIQDEVIARYEKGIDKFPYRADQAQAREGKPAQNPAP